MLIHIYDGTFEGLLTCIYEGYSGKRFADSIQKKGIQPLDIFAEAIEVTTDSVKAEKVWKGIRQRMPAKQKLILYYAFLTEAASIEMHILQFVQRLFSEEKNVETDFGDPGVLEIIQNARKVKKEAMRMMQFVRFQQTKEGIYFCGIEPLYDVLPLIVGHFRSRFADQHWLLYDLKRNYGAFYNKITVEEVELTSDEINRHSGKISENVLNESDAFYQVLWKSYFSHISIKERRNLRLQRQHMPRRFWKYLTEKQ